MRLAVDCDEGIFTCEVRINGVCVVQFCGWKHNEKGHKAAFRIQQEIIRAANKPSQTIEATQ